MKSLHWLAGAALCLSLSGALAAEGDKPRGDKPAGDKPGAKPEGRDKRDPAPRVPKPDKRALERLEKINGKPLTEEQSKAVQTAWEKRAAAQKAAEEQFRAEIAQTFGITVEAMAAKEKELRTQEATEGKGAPKEGPKDAPKP